MQGFNRLEMQHTTYISLPRKSSQTLWNDLLAEFRLQFPDVTVVSPQPLVRILPYL
jgi:hypothetical protein